MSEHARPESTFDYAFSIWRRRKILGLLVFLGVLATSIAFSMALPSLYRSTATVLVERPQVTESAVPGQVVGGEVEARLQTISQEILSRARLETLVSRFDLYPDLRKRGPTEMIVEQMRRDILLEPKVVEQPGGRASTIGFALSYRGPEPETVAAVTNALASFYVEQNTKIRERQTVGTAEFLKAQIAEMKKKLDDQERRMGDLPHDSTHDLAALEGLNTRLRMNGDHQLRALDRRDRILKEMRDAGVPTAGTLGTTDPTAARLAKLKAELGELKTRYSDKYPDVIRVKAEIADLERAAPAAPEPAKAAAVAPAKRGPDPLADVDAETRALKEDEKRLREAIGGYERRLENAPRLQQDFQRQARDYVTTKEMYATLLKRYEDAQMAESVEQGQRGELFRVLDAAVPSRTPMAPHRARLMLAGLMVSLGVAVGAVVLAERLDGSFHDVDDLRGFTRVPVLTSIPSLVTPSDRARRRRRLWLTTLATVVGLALIVTLVYVLAHGNGHLVRIIPTGA